MIEIPPNDSILPKGLAADGLLQDTRIAEAKTLILSAVKDHQKKFTGIKPPIESLKISYEEMLSSFAHYRGSKLWFPYLGSGFGKGPLVELADGSVKYDFICGIGPHYLGHNHPGLIDCGIDAAISNTVMEGNLQQNVDSFEITSLLVQSSGLAHCFLTSSGAMANENAMKISFQKKYPACRILAFEGCFVGRTLTMSQITDKPSFREGLPSNIFVDYVPFFDPACPEESTAAALKTLKKHLSRYPDQHAVMCFELIQGEGGFYSGTKEFFHSLMTVLKENKIAIFADEIQSFGRTPELFAFQYFGLEEYVDIVSIGKLSQVCATLFTEEYKPRPGLLSQTFTSSTSAIKASLFIIKELLSRGYFGPQGKISKLHQYFAEKLKNLSLLHPDLIRGPFGLGCMIAFTPYDGETQKVNHFVHRLFDAGVIGFIAGSNPTRVRFLIPAGAISFEDIDKAVKIIEQTLLSQNPNIQGAL